LGWESVFWLGGGLTLLLVPLVAVGMPESLRFLVLQGTERARIARMLGRLAPGRSFSPEAEYYLNEERGGVPVISLFTGGRAAKTAALWLAFFSTQLVVFFATSWLTAVFNQHGLSIADAITASSWFLAGGILGPMTSGWLADRWKPIAVVSGFELVAAILIALLGPAGAVPAVASLTAFLAGFCLFGSLGGLIALGAAVYPTAMRSTGLGWLSGTGRVGALVGAQLGGVLLATGMEQSQLFYIFAIPLLVAVGALAILDRVQRAPSPEVVPVS
jgi:AAHS family 4-hydroxybenzoate transporter-like MFS transporter